MNTRSEFHIGDILTVLHGFMVCPGGMHAVQAFAEFMAGEEVWTHQMTRVHREAAEPLRQQFPDLAAVKIPLGLNTEQAVLEWLTSLEPQFGVTRMVAPLSPDQHEQRDPILELFEMLSDR